MCVFLCASYIHYGKNVLLTFFLSLTSESSGFREFRVFKQVSPPVLNGINTWKPLLYTGVQPKTVQIGFHSKYQRVESEHALGMQSD